MNILSQAQKPGRAVSSLSPAQLETTAVAVGLPATDAPPELELGEVAVVIDEAGLIVAAEPICAALFQWDPTQLLGQPLEVLIVAGTETIREQLVPEPSAPGPGSEAQPRLFALAQRKDGTSFAAAVTLELVPPGAGCWWAVAFHDVNSSSVAQPEVPALHPRSSRPRRRAQVAAPLPLEMIPDIFHRVPAEPAPQSGPPATAAPTAPAPSVLPAPVKAGQDQPPPVDAAVESPFQQSQPQPQAPAAAPAPQREPSQCPPAAPPAPPAQTDSEAGLHELEQRLSQSAADLKRTRAHLQQQDDQLHAATTAARQAAASLEEQRARGSQLEGQLAHALQAGEEFNYQLAAEQQTRAESDARLQELEQRLAQTVEELQRAQAQSQPSPAPAPAPAETDPALQHQLLEFEARLRTAVTSLARATAELETERGERRRSEQRGATQAARMQQLHEELKNHLETEQIDHQRLTDLEHQLHEQTQQNDLIVAKLQSALQLEECERKRREAELQRSRFLSTDSARASRAAVNGLRRQCQPPVESLHHSACRLLQGQLSDEEKHLVQTMLENTLLLQTSLQESPEV